eukprot:COSAG05_NODE_1452_length_4847_cov_3.384794_1_plen_347_part_00
MSTFSVLGGVLSIMSTVNDENSAVDLLASKDPAELVVLAKTAASLRAASLFRVLCLALFHRRTAEQLRRSFGAIDDLPSSGMTFPESNAGNTTLRDLTETLDAKAVLPLMSWLQLDACSAVCQRCRNWTAPEMEQRVLNAMQEKSSSDPTMFSGSLSNLLKATAAVDAWVKSRSTRLDLSGIILAAAGWCGVLKTVVSAATETLVELDLSNCLIPFQCAELVSLLFASCRVLQHTETSHAGDDDEVEGWVFARWRLHTQQLDQSRAVVHAREEIFLVNVHLEPQEWDDVFAKIEGSRGLRRLYLTMCWIPHDSADALARVFSTCPDLRTVRAHVAMPLSSLVCTHE